MRSREAGVRVFLYDKGYLHSKTAITDGEICSVGTANIDIRSFSINYELNAVIYDEAIAQELEADFNQDLAECTEFTVEDYWKKSILIRLREFHRPTAVATSLDAENWDRRRCLKRFQVLIRLRWLRVERTVGGPM